MRLIKKMPRISNNSEERIIINGSRMLRIVFAGNYLGEMSKNIMITSEPIKENAKMGRKSNIFFPG